MKEPGLDISAVRECSCDQLKASAKERPERPWFRFQQRKVLKETNLNLTDVFNSS